MKFKISSNNLDLLRLAFALQVMVAHTYGHLDSKAPLNIGNFPGVPAFFFVSGFLIYASYLHSPSLKYYMINRMVRILPALFFVTLGGGFLFIILAKANITWSKGLVWFISQVSLGQAYNPHEFREIGVGVVNGSLWTITVEILFYCSVPLIIRMEKGRKWAIPLLFVFSFICYAVSEDLFTGVIFLGKTGYDFLKLTPIYWGWMFLIGILFFKYRQALDNCVRWLCLAPIFLLVLALFVTESSAIWSTSSNKLGLVYFCLYATTIYLIAFHTKIIKLNADISYGVYIWHMVIVNFCLIYDLKSPAFVIATTVLISTVSFYCIEKPALALKRVSLKPVAQRNKLPLKSDTLNKGVVGSIYNNRETVHDHNC